MSTEVPEKREKKKSKGKIVLIIVLVIVLLLGISVVYTYTSYKSSLKPIDTSNEEQITFVVKEGWNSADIAEGLKEEGLIKSDFFFKVHVKLSKDTTAFKAGKYQLSKSMSVDDMIAIIKKGTANENVVRFTIPEGYSLNQTIDVLVKKELGSKDDFLKEIADGDFDYKFMKGLPEGEKRLEGFLYPETYEVYKDASAHDIIDKMLGQFNKVFKPEYYLEAEMQKKSVYEIVTIASLIEREASIDSDRPTIGGVIANRIEKGMKLQIDATIQYLLVEKGEGREFLRKSDLEIDSPYNSYLYAGLPPGPICSPRITSITAALEPEDNDYLYYVLAPELDGHHRFSVDYNEFLKNKNAYYAAIKKRDNS